MFLKKRNELADYFDEEAKEDIFDYIPPQRTNQIFTPKAVVVLMADLLEKENPGCYDDPENTFIDPYMKSGMYITEVVKRLFASHALKEKYPDKAKRLQHIFEEQVYGLAPTEIIYRIAMQYIFGFAEAEDIDINKGHFVCFDTLPSAQRGTLAEDIEKVFEEKEGK